MTHSLNVIPDIERPTTWRQPSRAEILVNDVEAVMPESAFKELPEYSSTMPTGVYAGKMWKALNDGQWYLRWYGHAPLHPGYCTNNQRKLVVLDWKALMT